MNKLRSCIIGISAAVVLASAVALISPATSRGDSLKDVNVVNTPAQPIPTVIQGSVGVAGPIQAQQSGPWNVGILGNPTVKIDPTGNTVTLAQGGTKLAFNQSFVGMPTSGMNLNPIDISPYSKIRFSVTVNGSGQIQFFLLSGTGGQFPSGYLLDNFTVDSGGGSLTRTYDVAGLGLLIQMIPTDPNNQAIIGVFGN